MLKSLLISAFFPPDLGGIPNYLWHVCKKLPRDKVVVLTRPSKEAPKFDKNQPFKIYRQSFFSFKLRPSWLPLINVIRKIIDKENIQLLQFGHFAPYCSIGWFLKKTRKIPYLVYLHGVDLFEPQKSQLRKRMMLITLKNASRIIANSQFLKNEAERLGISGKIISIVHPGISHKRFVYSREKIKGLQKKYNLVDKKVIFSLGRIIPRKGQDMMIKAMPLVLKKVPKAVYLIAGEGEYKKELEELVHKLNLEKQVIFLGSIPDTENVKACYFYLSDVFAMPAREIKREKDVESFGIVYLEANACGKPVVGGKSGGAYEVIVDGQTGILVNPESSREIAQATIRLLLDKELARKLGEQGKKRVEEFDWDLQVKKIKNILTH